MTRTGYGYGGPVEDVDAEVARYRHEAVAVILQVRELASDPRLCVLAWRRVREPFAGRWALPSGPLAPQESIEESVRRHLATKLDLSAMAHLEQLLTSSTPGRDPSQRTVATAYLGLVPADQETVLPASASWLPVGELPELAFDHASMVAEGVTRMRSKISYTNLAFALAPRQFTMAILRDLYSVALGYQVDVTNVHRVLNRRGQLEATGEMVHPGRGGGRPAALYRFAARELRVTDPFATMKPHA